MDQSETLLLFFAETNQRQSCSWVPQSSWSLSFTCTEDLWVKIYPGGLFKGDDLHKVAQLSTSIEEMHAVTLNYGLSKFVIGVPKKSGETYPPATIYGIVCGIGRYQG